MDADITLDIQTYTEGGILAPKNTYITLPHLTMKVPPAMTVLQLAWIATMLAALTALVGILGTFNMTDLMQLMHHEEFTLLGGPNNPHLVHCTGFINQGQISVPDHMIITGTAAHLGKTFKTGTFVPAHMLLKSTGRSLARTLNDLLKVCWFGGGLGAASEFFRFVRTPDLSLSRSSIFSGSTQAHHANTHPSLSAAPPSSEVKEEQQAEAGSDDDPKDSDWTPHQSVSIIVIGMTVCDVSGEGIEAEL